VLLPLLHHVVCVKRPFPFIIYHYHSAKYVYTTNNICFLLSYHYQVIIITL
jgi:hypothetical protein